MQGNHQPLFDCLGRGLGTRVHAQLDENALNLISDCIARDTEDGRNLGAGLAFADPGQDFQFARGERPVGARCAGIHLDFMEDAQQRGMHMGDEDFQQSPVPLTQGLRDLMKTEIGSMLAGVVVYRGQQDSAARWP